jgi:hypothetical protein
MSGPIAEYRVLVFKNAIIVREETDADGKPMLGATQHPIDVAGNDVVIHSPSSFCEALRNAQKHEVTFTGEGPGIKADG